MWMSSKLVGSCPRPAATSQVQGQACLYLLVLELSQGRHMGCMQGGSGPELEMPSRARPKVRSPPVWPPRERPKLRPIVIVGDVGSCRPCRPYRLRTWRWHACGHPACVQACRHVRHHACFVTLGEAELQGPGPGDVPCPVGTASLMPACGLCPIRPEALARESCRCQKRALGCSRPEPTNLKRQAVTMLSTRPSKTLFP